MYGVRLWRCLLTPHIPAQHIEFARFARARTCLMTERCVGCESIYMPSDTLHYCAASVSAGPNRVEGGGCKRKDDFGADPRQSRDSGGRYNCNAHCNALQRTATHCNALQRTATHYNALQRTATHCNALPYCNVLPHPATHTKHTCNTQQHALQHCVFRDESPYPNRL